MNHINENQPLTEGVTVLRIIYKWRKQIILLAIIATAGAVVFTMPQIMLPYYKSEVIFYPPGTNSNKILIERDPRFGADKEIDEQMQILQSSIVRDSIISKYDLISHYKVDTTDVAWAYGFYKKIEDNINISRTRFNSISVKVYDTDPETAAGIANDMVKIGDAVKSAIIKENLKLAFNSISKEYFDKSLETDKIIESLNQFIDEPISLHLTQKDKSYTEKLKEQLDVQRAIEKARAAGRVKDLEALYNYQLKLQQLNEIQTSYFQAYATLNSAIPSCYVITPAEPSYKKAGPPRMMIVAVSLVAALVMGASLAVLIEKFRKIRLQVTG